MAVHPARHANGTKTRGQLHPVADNNRAVIRARRVALVLLLGVAAVLYGWAADRTALEPYYAASVRSMASSWHDFAFGALDPAATVSLDKLPGAFWPQALSARLFGFHGWALVLPQVVEGVLTVGVLYWAVRRLAGPVAGLVAAAVLALTPATTALDRGNISDSLMILLVVLAAAGVVAAIPTGRWAPIILAGVCVGLAFWAKMIEAWLVLPALGLVYLVDGAGPLRRRVGQLAVGGLVAAAVSMAWMAAISLVPARQRPYVDGSHHNSIFEQVFDYNGFGRLGQQTPLQLLSGQQLGIDLVPRAPSGAGRLFHGDLGRDIGWLLPLAAVAALWGLVSRRHAARGDGPRAAFVLWGTWLVTLAVVFSVTSDVISYYTAALAPPIAALLGTAVATALPARGRTPVPTVALPAQTDRRHVATTPPEAIPAQATPPDVTLGATVTTPTAQSEASPSDAAQTDPTDGALTRATSTSTTPDGQATTEATPPEAVREGAQGDQEQRGDQGARGDQGLRGEEGVAGGPKAGLGPGRSRSWRVGLAVVVAASVVWALVLIPDQGVDRPGWLVPAVAVLGAVAVLLALASAWFDRRVLLGAALAGGMVAVSCAPAVASVELTAHHRSAFDTPFESPAAEATVDHTFRDTPASIGRLVPRLEAGQRGAPYLLAVQTSAVASLFIELTGREALPLGGFTGTIPAPTVEQLRADVREGRFHLALVGGGRDPRVLWITTHCLPLRGNGQLHDYYCLPSNATTTPRPHVP